jgi:Zn-dependent protease
MGIGGRRGRLVVGLPRGALRPSPIFLGLVALTIAGAVMAWYDYGNQSLNIFLFVVAGWLVSLSLHEFAHALFAYRAGDTSVVARGYLTLNLLKYTHPLLSVVLPVLFLLLGGIGLPGGAVYVDRHSVRTRMGDSLISAAGPAVNVLFTIALTLPFWFNVDVFAHIEFWGGLAFLAFLQLTASLLNLLPIPGLDGGNMLRPWLSHEWGRRFDVIAPFGMLALFLLLFEPRVNRIFFDVVFWISDLIGLPPGLYEVGRQLLMFWT